MTVDPIEYQHVTGEWRITGYDSRDDEDALPEQLPLTGRVVFSARFDKYDRFATIYVPGAPGEPGHQLRVRDMMFAVVHGRLQDRQARDGVMLPAVIGGVPIIWTATPELYEDPGNGDLGPRVPADKVTWSPPEPNTDPGPGPLLPGAQTLPGVDVLPAAGEVPAPGTVVNREVDLGSVVDATIDYVEPVVSHVAYLVAQARGYEADAYTSARQSEAAARSSSRAATASRDSATAAGESATAAGESQKASRDNAAAAADSATAAGKSATASRDSATASDQARQAAQPASRDAATAAATAGDSATAAGKSATASRDSATAAAGSADAARRDADRSRDEADRARAAADEADAVVAAGAPTGGWRYEHFDAPTKSRLDAAETALQDVAVDDVGGLPEALDDKADLDVNRKVPRAQLPAHVQSIAGKTGDVTVTDIGAAPAHKIVSTLPATGTPGTLYLVPKS